VLFFSRPSEAQVDKFLADAAESRFSYAEVGATLSEVPGSYNIDHNRVLLGKGEALFHRAALAVRDWKMFDLGWVRVYPSAPAIRTGENVAVIARWGGLYFVNACRIVDTIHEHVPIPRFGFAYGTLEDHAESGEERFVVEWDRHTDEVWYDILAFSRPHQLLPRIGYPLARRLQKRFAADSIAAMVKVTGRAGL
jgi:uncharacterized protein (UPF0548 family)